VIWDDILEAAFRKYAEAEAVGKSNPVANQRTKNRPVIVAKNNISFAFFLLIHGYATKSKLMSMMTCNSFGGFV
jgi:hypothetical protein